MHRSGSFNRKEEQITLKTKFDPYGNNGQSRNFQSRSSENLLQPIRTNISFSQKRIKTQIKTQNISLNSSQMGSSLLAKKFRRRKYTFGNQSLSERHSPTRKTEVSSILIDKIDIEEITRNSVLPTMHPKPINLQDAVLTESKQLLPQLKELTFYHKINKATLFQVQRFVMAQISQSLGSQISHNKHLQNPKRELSPIDHIDNTKAILCKSIEFMLQFLSQNTIQRMFNRQWDQWINNQSYENSLFGVENDIIKQEKIDINVIQFNNHELKRKLEEMEKQNKKLNSKNEEIQTKIQNLEQNISIFIKSEKQLKSQCRELKMKIKDQKQSYQIQLREMSMINQQIDQKMGNMESYIRNINFIEYQPHQLSSGNFEINFKTQRYPNLQLGNYNENEVLHLTETHLFLKNGSNSIDVLKAADFQKVATLDTGFLKCILSMPNTTTFVGCSNQNLEVYFQNFKKKSIIQTQGDIINLANFHLIDKNAIICAQNNGYIDLVDTKSLNVILKTQLKEPHDIYQALQISNKNEVALATTHGLFFIKLDEDFFGNLKSEQIDETYLKNQFVNKIVEYQNGLIACAVWNSDTFIIIDRHMKQVVANLKHPSGSYQCWGLISPAENILISRDNNGLVIIYPQFSPLQDQSELILIKSMISKNLFGHGSILELQIYTMLSLFQNCNNFKILNIKIKI